MDPKKRLTNEVRKYAGHIDNLQLKKGIQGIKKKNKVIETKELNF